MAILERDQRVESKVGVGLRLGCDVYIVDFDDDAWPDNGAVVNSVRSRLSACPESNSTRRPFFNAVLHMMVHGMQPAIGKISY